MHLGHAPWPCTTISQCPRHRLQILTPQFSWPSQEREWARASCFCPRGREETLAAVPEERKAMHFGHAPWPCTTTVNDPRHRLQILTPQFTWPSAGKGMGAS